MSKNKHRKRRPHIVTMTAKINDIPDHWGPRTCRSAYCLATATKTLCQEPDRCTGEFCRESLVACDDHAADLAAAWKAVLEHPERGVAVPRSEFYGGHD